MLLALHKQMNRKKRPGWIRDTQIDVAGSLNEIVHLNQRIRELEEENRRLKAPKSKRVALAEADISQVWG